MRPTIPSERLDYSTIEKGREHDGGHQLHDTHGHLLRGRGAMQAVVIDAEEGRALFLFSSEEEAEEYRRETGTYTHAEGFVG